MVVTPNLDNAGHFIVSAFQASPLSGLGTLVNLKFNVIGMAGQTSLLAFEEYTDPGDTIHPACTLNEGKPASSTENGSISAVSAIISGTVTYGNPGGSPTPRFVSNVTLSGAGSPNVMTTSGGIGPLAGQYSLGGFGAGAYTVSPAKVGGQNGAINSFDAGKIAQHVAGISPLTGNQPLIADVSNNGVISSFDAAEIANYVVSGSPAGLTGTWKFSPVNRSYPGVVTDQTAQNYDAVIFGDVATAYVH